MICRTALLLALLLAGIGNLTAATEENFYDNIHNIVLVSAFGDTVSLDKIGITPIDTSHTAFDLDLGLDRQMLPILTRALSARFSVTPISADAKKIDDIVTLPDDFTDQVGDAFSDYLEKVARYLASLPSPENTDAIIAVIPTRYKAYSYPYDHRFNWGVGTGHTSGFLNSGAEFVWATYDIVVVDKKTGEIVSSPDADALGHPTHATNTMGIRCPLGRVWAPTPSEFTVDQKKALGEEIRRVVWAKLPQTLKLVRLPSDVDISSALPPQPSICKTDGE